MIASHVLKANFPMTPHQKRMLEKLSKSLEEAQAVIQELLRDEHADSEQGLRPEIDAQSVLAAIKGLGRVVAKERLDAMKQHELGALFVESGGSSSDKKKPKVWLVEQILWRVFDFERGHEAIRNKGAGES